jgi:protein-S-isoprenylcysteine O-methyltransferase Ste14
MSLLIRNLVFTIVIPGGAGMLVPWLIVSAGGAVPVVAAWPAVLVIGAGAGVYGWAVASFAIVGRGTPGPWDAPRRVVAAGPYRWVRNPIYIAALLIVAGQAMLFASPLVLAYTCLLAVGFQLIVVGYEEPNLVRRFDGDYEAYRQSVPRWLPRRPS